MLVLSWTICVDAKVFLENIRLLSQLQIPAVIVPVGNVLLAQDKLTFHDDLHKLKALPRELKKAVTILHDFKGIVNTI